MERYAAAEFQKIRRFRRQVNDIFGGKFFKCDGQNLPQIRRHSAGSIGEMRSERDDWFGDFVFFVAKFFKRFCDLRRFLQKIRAVFGGTISDFKRQIQNIG